MSLDYQCLLIGAWCGLAVGVSLTLALAVRPPRAPACAIEMTHGNICYRFEAPTVVEAVELKQIHATHYRTTSDAIVGDLIATARTSEREACALVAENQEYTEDQLDDGARDDIARSIRARGTS